MADLIDRQALGIGYANPLVFDKPDYAHGWNCAIEIIQKAPTIDPESLRPKGEWISVEDRLPEESGLYITFGCTAVPVRWLHNFDKDIGKFGAWWNYEPDGKEHPQYRFIEAGNITHWMPLPEPPVADMRSESR